MVLQRQNYCTKNRFKIIPIIFVSEFSPVELFEFPQFRNPNLVQQDSPTSLNEREMASSDENLKVPSSWDDNQNLHKQME